MAKQTLPVDFKDDVLNASMDGKRRYRLLLQEDGTYVLEDVTDYDTVGSTFGAAQINQTNQAVNQSADKGDVLGTLSQVKSNSDAKKIASANSLKELAVASNLKTYTTLAQLSLSAPVTVEQIFSAMPNNSYVQIDANNPNVITNIPINSSGLLEISKIAGGRNFARFTESVSTNAANKTMWYGVFSWSGSVAFGGWKKILERDEILATDEEIEANTDPNKIASAVAVKRLNSDFENRFTNNINLQTLPLKSAIAHIADNNFSEFRGSFDVVVSTSEGWFRVEGYRDFDGSAFGFANALGGTNIPYCYDRTAGADAVVKKLGEPDIKSISGSLAYNLERVPQNAQAGISAPSGYVITKINITSATANADVAYRFTTNTGVNQGFTGAMSKDLSSVSSVTVICEKTQNITAVSGSVSFNVEIKKM